MFGLERPHFRTHDPVWREKKERDHQAKEFTNLFWGLMHEILDFPLERLVFDTDEGADNR